VDQPYITVLVVAHTRKKFLLKAVNSAVQQSVPRSQYDVLVIKNFMDSNVDSKLAELGVRSVYSCDQSVGGKIYEALEHIETPLVTFLEDDDLYYEYRLERIKKLFTRDVVYYHNAYSLIDENDNPITPRNEQGNKELLKVIGPQKTFLHSFLLARDAHSNMSSIAIRTNILNRHRHILRKIRITPDLFVFYACLLDSSAMVLDDLETTKYRVHNLNNFYIANVGSFGDYLARWRRKCVDMVADLKLILGLLEGTPYYAYVKRKLVYWKLKSQIFSSQDVYKASPRELLEYLVWGADSHVTRRLKDSVLWTLPTPIRMSLLRWTYNRKVNKQV
jgi:glycosyltransferase involved in cell wall biosynthesis